MESTPRLQIVTPEWAYVNDHEHNFEQVRATGSGPRAELTFGPDSVGEGKEAHWSDARGLVASASAAH